MLASVERGLGVFMRPHALHDSIYQTVILIRVSIRHELGKLLLKFHFAIILLGVDNQNIRECHSTICEVRLRAVFKRFSTRL